MAYLNFTGFETGDFSEFSSSGGTIQSAIKRTGTYALLINSGNQIAELQGLAADGSPADWAVATIYTTFYLYVDTKPSATSEHGLVWIDTNAAVAEGNCTQIILVLDDEGHINLLRRLFITGNNTEASGTTALSEDTWYRIDWKVTANGVSSAYELLIDGVSEWSGTLDAVGATASTNTDWGHHSNFGAGARDYYLDDIAVSDSAYPGAGEVHVLTPDGTGAATAWSDGAGTAPTNVAEIPHDSDTGYITSSTTGQAETETLISSSVAGIAGTIATVKSLAIVRDEGGASAIQARLRAGTTNDDTSSSDPGASYVLRAKLYDVNPDDSAAWANSDLDGTEVGVDNAASVAARATALYVMVLSAGAATPLSPPFYNQLARGPRAAMLRK